jgi:hypothetical protein
MSCADYVFPSQMDHIKILDGDYEPYTDYPLTELAIKRSIAYVHYGVNALEEHPDGVERRNKFEEGTVVGDVFWKAYSFARPGFMSRPVATGG